MTHQCRKKEDTKNDKKKKTDAPMPEKDNTKTTRTRPTHRCRTWKCSGHLALPRQRRCLWGKLHREQSRALAATTLRQKQLHNFWAGISTVPPKWFFCPAKAGEKEPFGQSLTDRDKEETGRPLRKIMESKKSKKKATLAPNAGVGGVELAVTAVGARASALHGDRRHHRRHCHKQ